MNRFPGQSQQMPRSVALDPFTQGQRVPTHLPGIDRVMPAGAALVSARVSPTQYVRLGSAVALVPADSQDFTIEWRTPGQVISCMAVSTLGTPEAQGNLGMKIQVGPAQTEMCSNGNTGSGDFVRFAAICGLNPLGPGDLMQQVLQNDKWIITVKNFHPSTTYTPDVTFWFRACV